MSQGQLASLTSSSSLVIFGILDAFFSKNVLISSLVLSLKKKNNIYYYSFRKYIKANYRDKIGELLNLSNCNGKKREIERINYLRKWKTSHLISLKNVTSRTSGFWSMCVVKRRASRYFVLREEFSIRNWNKIAFTSFEMIRS